MSAWHIIAMQNIQRPDSHETDGPILPWRFVAGAFLHCIVPVYLVSVVIDTLLTTQGGTTGAEMLRHTLGFSGWFVAGYASLALLGVSGAAVCDPLLRARRARRMSRDPEIPIRLSERRVRDAVAEGGRLFGTSANTHLSAIQSLQWHHADPRYQALSVDLRDVIAAATGAVAEVSDDRRPAIVARTDATLGRIETALRDLEGARSRRAAGDVEVVARYVEARYGSSDFSGSGG